MPSHDPMSVEQINIAWDVRIENILFTFAASRKTSRDMRSFRLYGAPPLVPSHF
jgi:hypothetical protein